jgi:hypothetical protein
MSLAAMPELYIRLGVRLLTADRSSAVFIDTSHGCTPQPWLFIFQSMKERLAR